jgi:hypothetical protein
LLLPFWGAHKNQKKKKKKKEEESKEKILKKKVGRKSQKYISKKNIPERPGNYRRLIEEDQNIQD